MKKVFFMAIAVGCSLLGSYTCASVPSCFSKSGKIYVDPSVVQISKEGIAVDTGRGIIKILRLRTGSCGLYFLEKDVLSSEKFGQWYYSKCRKCGAIFFSPEQERVHKCKYDR